MGENPHFFKRGLWQTYLS